MKLPLQLLLLPLLCLPSYANPNNVGVYVGVAVTRNKQGHDSSQFAYDRNSSVTGATVQSRIPLIDLGSEFMLSTRPYFVASPAADGSTGLGLGNSLTIDIPISKSKANLYVGVGYQVGLTGGLSSYEAATSSQFVFSTGIEGRISKNVVGFIDLKLPTVQVEGSAYSPIMSTGLGIKF